MNHGALFLFIIFLTPTLGHQSGILMQDAFLVSPNVHLFLVLPWEWNAQRGQYKKKKEHFSSRLAVRIFSSVLKIFVFLYMFVFIDM